jgi:hypothetical protein
LVESIPKNNTYLIDPLNLKNPKLTTLTFIQQEIEEPIKMIFISEEEKIAVKEQAEKKAAEVNKIRAERLQDYQKISSIEELEAHALRWGAGLPLDIDHQNVKVVAIKKIITQLNDSGIKVGIFTTPRHHFHWDNLAQEDKDAFYDILDDISKNYDTKVYFLHNEYVDLDIWYDSHHITMHPDGLVYSSDVAEIIIKLVEK